MLELFKIDLDEDRVEGCTIGTCATGCETGCGQRCSGGLKGFW